jgi:MFS family permease
MTAGAASYRGLFARPLLRRLALADICARLPQGMVSLTLLLVAAQHASMTVAGLVVAGYTLGQAATGPLRGRLADRRGLVPVAAVCTLGYALTLLALLALTAAAVITIAAPARRPKPARQPEPVRRSRFSPLRSAALRDLLITAALTNAALSATEVALTAYVRHHHALWASGPLLAGISLGSIVGSLLLGAQSCPKGHGRRLPRLLAGYTAGLAILTGAALGYPYLLALAAPLAGLCLGPTLATLFGTAAAAAPPGSGTETQAWVNSIMNGGGAAGAAVAGLAAGRRPGSWARGRRSRGRHPQRHNEPQARIGRAHHRPFG